MISTPLRTVVLAALCALVLPTAASQAAGPTQTVRVFSKPVSITLTHADGTVVRQGAVPRRAARRRARLLIFRGNPATLIAGTGLYAGATGKVLSNREVAGGNDVVAKIRLAKH